MVRLAGLCATLSLLIALPVAAETAGVRLGDLIIDYDPARWQVAARPEARESDRLTFVCVAADCRGRPSVTAFAAPASDVDPTDCSPDGLRADDGGNMRWRRGILPPSSPLPLVRWTRFSGCRAYVPAAERACLLWQGTIYRFASGANSGCRGTKGVDGDDFDALLAGLRPAGRP